MVLRVDIINGENIPILGGGRFVYLGIISVLISFILFRFFKKYLQFSQEEKTKAQYFIVGFTVFILVNFVFNIFFPLLSGNAKCSCIGNHSAIFFLTFTAYAIIKEQLFGIKVILTYLMVSFITVLLAVDLFSFTTIFSLQVLKFFTLLIFLYFGRSLVRSVTREIKLKEQLQDLNIHLQDKVDEQTKEIKSAYEVEKKARIKLEELDKVKDEFISTAAHQLRTPLAGTRWALKSLLDGTLQKENERKDMLEKIYESNNNLITIVGDLLDTSSIEKHNETISLDSKEGEGTKVVLPM